MTDIQIHHKNLRDPMAWSFCTTFEEVHVYGSKEDRHYMITYLILNNKVDTAASGILSSCIQALKHRS